MATTKRTATKKATPKRRSAEEIRRRGIEDGKAASVISLPKKAK